MDYRNPAELKNSEYGFAATECAYGGDYDAGGAAWKESGKKVDQGSYGKRHTFTQYFVLFCALTNDKFPHRNTFSNRYKLVGEKTRVAYLRTNQLTR